MLNLEGTDIFPHSFVNKNTIAYKGFLPENKYFKNLKKEDYLQMAENHSGIWSIKIV